MKNIKKVIVLAPGFSKDEGDTSCIPALADYVRNLAKFHPELKIFVIAFQYPFIRGWYKWHGIDVYTAGGKNRGKIHRLITWGTVFLTFVRIIMFNKIDVIHTFWLDECAFVGQYLSMIFGIKHVGTILGQDAKDSNKYLKYIDFKSMTVTCGSTVTSETFKKSTGKAVDVLLPIGFDESVLCDKKRGNDRSIDILGVGALIPLKNYSVFIDVIAELKGKYPNIKAVLIGDGVERQELLDKIKGMGLSDNIKLTGHILREEVFDKMLDSKILLHPSTYEGQVNVFMEALYCGLEIVCFNIGHMESSVGIYISSNTNEMTKNVEMLLQKDYIDKPILLKSMKDTVEDFIKIYQ